MKKHLFTYLLNVMFSFGLTTAFLSVIVRLLGDRLKGEASIAALGSEGLPTAFLMQLLIAVMIVMALRKLFLSDLCFKHMQPSLRVLLTLVSALLTMLGFILAFGWFPPHGLTVFIPGAVIVIVLNSIRMLRREKTENKALSDALSQYQSSHTA